MSIFEIEEDGIEEGDAREMGLYNDDFVVEKIDITFLRREVMNWNIHGGISNSIDDWD